MAVPGSESKSCFYSSFGFIHPRAMVMHHSFPIPACHKGFGFINKYGHVVVIGGAANFPNPFLCIRN